jgi:hypothetical protein
MVWCALEIPAAHKVAPAEFAMKPPTAPKPNNKGALMESADSVACSMDRVLNRTTFAPTTSVAQPRPTPMVCCIALREFAAALQPGRASKTPIADSTPAANKWSVFPESPQSENTVSLAAGVAATKK